MSNRKVFKLSIIAAACMAAMSVAQADTITGIQDNNVGTQSQVVTDYPFGNLTQFGYGGWNLDNVSVKIVDAETGEPVAKSFDPVSGTYSAMVEGDSFASFINDGTNIDTPTAKLTGKNWPVGEPSGVKVLTDLDTTYTNNGKPASCIMSTSFHPFSDDSTLTVPDGATEDDGYLNSAPDFVNPTMCDSAFQTHKRFKVSALPASVELDGSGQPKAIDMVFNVEDGAAAAGTTGVTATRYMVLQKLNNYTDKHLKGFTLQVGTGVGDGFNILTDASVELSDGVDEKVDGAGVLIDPPADIWDPEDMATFSAGLFGPGDTVGDTDIVKHDPGFFDNLKRAGFTAAEDTAPETTVMNQIASTGVLNEYVIDGQTTSTYEHLFGSKWLPSIYEPKGIFYDFDNDTTTDDKLVAWWGDNPNTTVEDYQWLLGAADGYRAVTAAELAAWSTSSEPYYVGGIEDVLNLGLSYIVDVGDVTGVEATGNFTLRMIPIVDETKVDYVPGFTEEENQPPASLEVYAPSSGGSSASVMDNAGMFATLLAFLGLGGWIVRRKLAK